MLQKPVLDYFFKPGAIAIVGASSKEGSIGFTLLNNLQKDGFAGPVYPINPKHDEIMGLKAYPSVIAVGSPIDLVIIAVPIHEVPAVMKECGEAQVKGAIIISAGGKEVGEEGARIEEEIRAEAKRGGIRYLGPNCMGILSPVNNLNASFAAHSAEPGSLALLSQSGAVCSAILDRAAIEKIGFSHFVSIGSMADLDFADMIDYLGNDRDARSIIIYMENMTRHRKFMSAARSVSRVKPIIVVKSGRSEAAAKAAASHTGSLAGRDDAYNAAFRRAGIIRVDTISQLFSCAQALGKMQRPIGSNLAFITNAGGPGVMAVDALSNWGFEPAQLSPETFRKLDEFLPAFWSRGNPIDILGDAPPDRYVRAVRICLEARELSGLIVILTPQAMTDPTGVARALANEIKDRSRRFMAVWMGARDVEAGIRILNEAGIPTFDTPEEAVDTFMHMYSYTRNLELLQETPPSFPHEIYVNKRQARTFINECIRRGQRVLTEVESKAILSAYGIPVNRTVAASSSQAAAEAAKNMGFPVVVKIFSPDITHKSDVDGVRLNLKSEQDVAAAFDEITSRAAGMKPGARITGVTVQSQVKKSEIELIVGSKRDPQFGPLLLFGMGGVLTEVLKDSAVALPPLNLLLARRLMERTRVYRLLQGYRNIPAADVDRTAEFLVRVSQLVSDFPEIVELDLNPVVISNGRPVAIDARMVVEASETVAPRHLIISPYPNQYESEWLLADGTPVLIRPMKPEDEFMVKDLLDNCSAETIYFRYFSVVKNWPHESLVRFTQYDYDREIGIAAIGLPPGPSTMMGVGRLVMPPDRPDAEFAVIIGDPWQGKGLGEKLIERVIEIARENGVQTLVGDVLPENEKMLSLVRKLGFRQLRLEEGTCRVELDLNSRLPAESLGA
ncbi:MAG: bifunctional acetate--CoA ligase family protein/GNAT family N-acetyltransferase [Deltaproteobacteria bacterium]|jgi:acetyltransferase|nr:bifunctional acetate--CoA ligase family protein/GNAT family N-acetyltransferase [Deltaproteobacteria bacterium]